MITRSIKESQGLAKAWLAGKKKQVIDELGGEPTEKFLRDFAGQHNAPILAPPPEGWGDHTRSLTAKKNPSAKKEPPTKELPELMRLADTKARKEVEDSLHRAAIVEDPDLDGGLLG